MSLFVFLSHLFLTLLLLRALSSPAELVFRRELKPITVLTDWVVKPLNRFFPNRPRGIIGALMVGVIVLEIAVLLFAGPRPERRLPFPFLPLVSYFYSLLTICVFGAIFIPPYSQSLIGKFIHRLAAIPNHLAGGGLSGEKRGWLSLAALSGIYFLLVGLLFAVTNWPHPFRNAIMSWGIQIDRLVGFFIFILLLRIILSWFSPDPSNPLTLLLYQISEPYLGLFRRFIPPVGMLDLSPILAFFVLVIAKGVFINIIKFVGEYL